MGRSRISRDERTDTVPVSWLRAFGLLLALLALSLPAFAQLAHANAVSRLAAGAVDGYTVICTPLGLEIVPLASVDGEQQPDTGLPIDAWKKTGKFYCCLAGGLVLPPVDSAGISQPRLCDAPRTAPPAPHAEHARSIAPPERPGHPRDSPAV